MYTSLVIWYVSMWKPQGYRPPRPINPRQKDLIQPDDDSLTFLAKHIVEEVIIIIYST